jgi:deoxyribodipyrimidine photolyase-related protein
VDGFDLPVTRAQALEALDDFVTHRLAEFGPFEDAMLSGERTLYHSRLSAAMNVGLLHPAEMVEAAVTAWENGDPERRRRGGERGRAASAAQRGTGIRSAAGAEESEDAKRPQLNGIGTDSGSLFPAPASPIPLSSLEGFVRQIIGWREYVNGIYWQQMPGYREVNYFGFTRPLPQLFWEPERTDLACLKDVVTSVRDTAFAHHIPRLMILCNFAVLTGVHPLRLSEWFWAGFADAMEWVELPNVVGMGTFGDGGLLASKPYVSSAAYINRMSNYCGGCRYNPKLRTGPDACPFNYLYWTFLDDVRGEGGTGKGERGTGKRLDIGQRMALVLKQLEKIAPTELAAMREARARFLRGIEADSTGWAFHHDQG